MYPGSGWKRLVSCICLSVCALSALPGHAQEVAHAGKASKLTVGGMIQAQGEFGDAGDSRFAKNNRFLLRRTRLNAQGGFAEGFDFKVEMELGGTGGALRAQLTDGYVQWNASNVIGIRFGQFKTPFGYEQLASDPVLFTIERSLPNDRLTLSRQLGVQVSATAMEKRFSATAGAFNGNGANNGFNDNEDFMVVGRVSATPIREKSREVSLGAGVYASQDAGLSLSGFGFDAVPGGNADNLFTGARRGLGLDAQVRAGVFEVWAEYLRARFEPDNGIPDNRLTADGWYVQGSAYFAKKKFQGVVKYEAFDPDVQTPDNATRTWLAGLNGYVKAHDIKVQIHVQRSDAPGLSSGENKVFVRTQILF